MASDDKEQRLLVAKGSHCDYSISVWGGVYIADCSSDRTGSKFWCELPRAGKSVRGCKMLIAKLSNEKLKWEAA